MDYHQRNNATCFQLSRKQQFLMSFFFLRACDRWKCLKALAQASVSKDTPTFQSCMNVSGSVIVTLWDWAQDTTYQHLLLMACWQCNIILMHPKVNKQMMVSKPWRGELPQGRQQSSRIQRSDELCLQILEDCRILFVLWRRNHAMNVDSP